MGNYAIIKYEEIQLLIDIDIFDTRFSPYHDRITRFEFLPSYVEGITLIDGNVTVVMDLAKFMGVEIYDAPDRIFLIIDSPHGNIALVVPPVSVDTFVLDERLRSDMPGKSQTIPASAYYLIDGEMYLRVDIRGFSQFLAKEMDNLIGNTWGNMQTQLLSRTDFKVSSKRKSSVQQASSRSRLVETGIEFHNYLRFRLSDVYFLISDYYVMDIITINQAINQLEDQYTNLYGMFDYYNEAIPIFHLQSYLELEFDENRPYLMLVLMGKDQQKYALLADEVSAFRFPDFIPKLHEETLDSTNTPFLNIYDYEGEGMYELNLGLISERFLTDAPIEWDDWKKYFQQTKHYTLATMRSSEVMSELVSSFEYMRIDYGPQSVLLELSQFHTFHPYFPPKPVSNVPDYCVGHEIIGQDFCILIDLAKLFGIEAKELGEGATIIKFSGQSLNYGLVVPNTDIVNIPVKEIIGMDHALKAKDTIPIPISKYFMFNGIIYSLVQYNPLYNFMAEEFNEYTGNLWNSLKETWNFKNLYLPEKRKIRHSQQREFQQISGFVTENLAIMHFGDLNFSIPESSIVEILSSKPRISEVDDSSAWIKGSFDYKGETILLLDLRNWMDFEYEFTNEVAVVINIAGNILGVLCGEISFAKRSDLKHYHAARKQEIDLLFPFNTIYQQEDGTTIFDLNYEFLLTEAMAKIDIPWKKWHYFLQSGTNKIQSSEVSRTQIIEEIDKLQLESATYKYSMEFEGVVEIRTLIGVETTIQDDIQFAAYKGQWIPQFSMASTLDNPDANNDIGVVMEFDNLLAELVFDRADIIGETVKLDSIDLKKLVIDNLNGVEFIERSGDDILYHFNPFMFTQNTVKAMNKNMDFVKLMDSVEFSSLPDFTIVDQSFQLSSIWDKKAKLFLVINSLENEEEDIFAMNTDKIVSFEKTPEEKDNIIDWNYKADDEDFIYAMVGEGKQVVPHRIPASCYLFAVPEEHIEMEKGKVTALSIDQKRIKVIN